MHPDMWFQIGGAAALTVALAGVSLLLGRALGAVAQGGWKNLTALRTVLMRPLDAAAAYELFVGLSVMVALYALVRTGGRSHLWPVVLLAALLAALGARLPAQVPTAEGANHTHAFGWTLLVCFVLSVLSYVQLNSGSLIEINTDQGFYYRLARWMHLDSSEALLIHARAEGNPDAAQHPAYHYWDIWLLSLGMQVGLSGAAASGLVFKALVGAVGVTGLAQLLLRLHPQGLGLSRVYILALMGMGLYVVIPIGRLGLPQGSALGAWLAPFGMIDRLDNVVFRHKLLLLVAGGWIVIGQLAQQRLVSALAVAMLLWFLNPLYFLGGSVAGAAALLLAMTGNQERKARVVAALVLVFSVGTLGAVGVMSAAYPKANSGPIDLSFQHARDAWPQLLGDVALSVVVMAVLGWALLRWTATDRPTRMLLLSFWTLSVLGYAGIYYSPLLAWNFEIFQARFVFWPTLLLMVAVLLLTLSLARLNLSWPRLAWVVTGTLLIVSTGYLIQFFQLSYERRYLHTPALRISHADCAGLAPWAGQTGAIYIDPETQSGYPGFPSSQLQLCNGLELLIDLPSPAVVASCYSDSGKLKGARADLIQIFERGFHLTYPHYAMSQAPLRPRQDYDSLAVRYVRQYGVRWVLALSQSALPPVLAARFRPTQLLSDARWRIYVAVE